MDELRFARIEDDRLILAGPDDAEYALSATEELRQALRELPRAEVPELPLVIPEVLRPKDIQMLVREGANPDDLANTSGLALDQVMRYAAPVLDERAYMAERAGGMAINHDQGAPTLRQAVEAKLALEGADPALLVWDALRERDSWVVRVDWETADGPGRARWAINLQTHHLEPLSKQAAWLIERDEPDSPIPPVRHLSAVQDVPDLPGDTGEGYEPDDHEGLEPPLSLLDDLLSQRGLRDPLDYERPDYGGDPLGSPAEVLELRPAAAGEPTPAYAAFTLEESWQVESPPTVPITSEAPLERVSIRDRTNDEIGEIQMTPDGELTDPGGQVAQVEPEPEPEPPAPPVPPTRSRAKRSSVPSWDEIVFGAPRADS
ncbi:MAG: DUF3071 domain-containing protein [Bifidobacteriaceae bacterium]|jgi:hypothetical protein|nr:DUF3071 domain-containing protein [Bifidobacteriaceae bacterium]